MQQNFESSLYTPNSWVLTSEPIDSGDDVQAGYEWVHLDENFHPSSVLHLTYFPAGCEPIGGGLALAYMGRRVIASISELVLENLQPEEDGLTAVYSFKPVREGDLEEIKKYLSERKKVLPEGADKKWEELSPYTQDDDFDEAN